jgi:hypothetical protein
MLKIPAVMITILHWRRYANGQTRPHPPLTVRSPIVPAEIAVIFILKIFTTDSLSIAISYINSATPYFSLD